MYPALSKQQFADLVKNKILWPDWNYQLANTIDGILNSSNLEIEGVVEIIIDTLYTLYLNNERWIEIIDVGITDGISEGVVFSAPGNTVKVNDTICIYNSPNFDGRYTVVASTANTIVIGVVYREEVISDETYYTIVSPDGYTESDYQYFERGSEVLPYNSTVIPKYLPYIGQKIGYKYDPRLTVAQNRDFIRSAISVYRIKGTILSIKRMMSLLGYQCEVYEPYKNMYRYGKSTYSGLDHITDARYLMLYTFYDIQKDARRYERDKVTAELTSAFVEGRLKKRKIKGQAAYKVKVEPRQASINPA